MQDRQEEDSTPFPLRGDCRESVTDPARRFLSRLLNDLAVSDPEAHASLTQADPDLLLPEAEGSPLRRRVQEVLLQRSIIPIAEAQSATRKIAAHEESQTATSPPFPPIAPPGILTSITQRVPPERALELYSKIAPVFVVALLGRLDRSAKLKLVHRIVEHLCSQKVQERLRRSEHVRDAILAECRAMLPSRRRRESPTREDVQRALEESGAVNDLIALENCILLSRAQAG